MKKILLISNSFGVDATRYLYGIARKAGDGVTTACLFIGGCPLSRHYRNMISEDRAYQLYFNGSSTPFRVSLAEALLADDWDIVTFQQASPLSGDYSSYIPYLPELSDYVKELAPNAKQYIHAIWAWSDARINKGEREVAYSSSADMFAILSRYFSITGVNCLYSFIRALYFSWSVTVSGSESSCSI